MDYSRAKLKYANEAGKHAKNAAQFFAKGESKRAKKHADMAVQEQDLLHPDLWRLWSRSSPDFLASALEHFSEAEARKVELARDGHGWDVVNAFCHAPGLLHALRGAGVDLGKPSSLLGSVEVSAKALLAFQGDAKGLEGLMRAGFEPPGPLSPAESGACGKNYPKTIMHAMAASLMQEHFLDAKAWSDLVGWLALGAKPGSRDANGRDELKIAIDAGNCAMASALLDWGIDPRQVDAKARDALQVLDRRVKSMGSQSRPAAAESLLALRSKLLAKLEAREVDGSAGLATEPARSKARSL